MTVPPKIKYQHEQNNLRTKIKRAEKRKQEKELNMFNELREKIRKKSKSSLKHFDELVKMKEKIKSELNEIALQFNKKTTRRRTTKKSSK
jgi:hypothetical protein